MANFISITSSAAGLQGGEYLINVDHIITVETVDATSTKIQLSTLTATEDAVTLTHTSTGTVPSVRAAIVAALTPRPGGVKTKVVLPAGISVTAIALD